MSEEYGNDKVLSRDCQIIKSIVEGTEYNDPPRSEEEYWLLKLKDTIEDEERVESENYGNRTILSRNCQILKSIVEEIIYEHPPTSEEEYWLLKLKETIESSILKDFPGLPSSIVTVTDAIAKPLDSLKVAITPVQSGSGDPSPDNIRPISGWTGVNIVVRNNEFFDKTKFVAGPSHKIKLDDGAVSNQDGFSYTANFIEVSGGISVGVIGTITPSQKASRLYFYDAKKNWIGRSNAFKPPATISIPDNAKYIQFQYYMSVIDTDTIHIKPRGTETVDYQGQDYTIAFPSEAGTVYGGTLDVTNGVLTVDRAYAELSQDWAWTKSSNYQGSFYATVREILRYKVMAPFMCSHAKTINNIANYVYGGCFCDGSINFWLMDANATVQDWKDYIVAQKANETPITICYELATPQTYQLTPTEVQMLLGTNNIWADTGDILEGKYYGKKSSATRQMLNTLRDAGEVTEITPEEPEENDER